MSAAGKSPEEPDRSMTSRKVLVIVGTPYSGIALAAALAMQKSDAGSVHALSHGQPEMDAASTAPEIATTSQDRSKPSTSSGGLVSREKS